MRNKNIVSLCAVSRRPLALVMDYMPRGSLYKVLHETEEPLTQGVLLRMAIDIASGMNFLHSGTPQVVHRDLKSLNVLLDEHMTAKICDFGLAQFLKKQEKIEGTSGTPYWMAPEIFSGKYGPAVDVYAFGIILNEMFSRRVPYADDRYGADLPNLLPLIVNSGRRPSIPARCPTDMKNLMVRCWDANPDNRPTFTVVLATLKEIQNGFK